MKYAVLFVGLFMAYTPNASAWQWNDVQRWAQEVEDRADDVYDRALSESRADYADEEYALELLWNLAIQADQFSDQVDRHPWLGSSYTRDQYHQLYQAYYRAEQGLRYANFSYHVDSLFQQVSWAMNRLQSEYRYSYRHDGWAFGYYRDHWYITLGHRHYVHRNRYRELRRDRIRRRQLRRDRWDRQWRNDRRYDRRPRRDVRPNPNPRRDRVRPNPNPRRDRVRPNPNPRRDRVRPNPNPRRDRVRPNPNPRRDRVRPNPNPRRDRVRPNPRPERRDRVRPDRGRSDRGRNSGNRRGRRPRN